MNNQHSQHGLSLVEVLVALIILVSGALAAANLQTTALTSAQISSFHFSLNHLANEAIESLRSRRSEIETGGGFKFDPLDTAPTSPTNLDLMAQDWNSRVAQSIPSAQGTIDCAADVCNVSISWLEEIDGSLHTQFYRANTPL